MKERMVFFMFILSVKAKKSKVLFFILIVLLIAGLLYFKPFDEKVDVSVNAENINTNEDLVEFLAQFNWEVVPEPVEVIEIIIPSEFGDVYNNYNEIQKAQGFDLSDYRGVNCKRYSYSVLNYPDFPSDVRANILVYNTKVIGGDISLIRIDGFMHGFID